MIQECTFVVDASHLDDREAIMDTMGDWDANVKSNHAVLKAAKNYGGKIYSVKKRYQLVVSID